MAKLYGVGVGPGDPELITIKAARILREADIIVVPKPVGGERTAFNIAREYIKDKPTAEFGIPMTRDTKTLDAAYKETADMIEGHLKSNRTVAVITLGDPTVYSSYMRVNRIIAERGYETELVAGVTSFCAAAARLNMSLCERREPLIIIPSGADEDLLKIAGTKVLMKAGQGMKDVIASLKEMGLCKKSVMVERCGMDGERIYALSDEIPEESSYFSTIIIKDNGDD